jgi:ATP-dependent Clp protease ATP-binding subunit ClpA
LILIDEIDKAHPDIAIALMGMMDHGALQLRRPFNGRWSLDCRQAILLFTSNAGYAELAERMERSALSSQQLESLARQVLITQGMPEWIAGRHGHIAVYLPLPPGALAEIATLEVDRLAQEFGLELAWIEPEVVAHLLHESDAGSTGARAVRSVIARLVGPAFAEHRATFPGSTEGSQADGQRVVMVGPEPRCVTYASWSATDFSAPDGPETPPPTAAA